MAAAGDAEELAAATPESDASEFDFSAGVELSRRPLGWNGKPKGRALIKPDEVRLAFSPHERLLILDTWQRSGLPAGDFAPLVGLSKHTFGGAVKTHLISVEETVRRTWPGRIGGAAAGREDWQ